MMVAGDGRLNKKSKTECLSEMREIQMEEWSDENAVDESAGKSVAGLSEQPCKAQ
jgi:hypothetical protein